MWTWLGPALKGLNADLKTLETSGVSASGNISASQVTTGVLATARLGTGTADASTVLYGDATWKTAPTGGGSASWAAITDKPTFAAVAISGSYADLANKPTIPTTFAASAITSGTMATARLYTSGGVGLYCEDSRAEFSGVTVTSTAGTATLL